MIVPSTRPSKLVFSSLIMVAVMASIQLAHAKRGCAAFGHSCYGGHGKRTDPIAKANDREEVGVLLPNPSGDIRTMLMGNEPPIPVDFFDGYQSDGEGSNLVQVYPTSRDISDVLRLSPIFQKWLEIVHRRRDSTADGN